MKMNQRLSIGLIAASTIGLAALCPAQTTTSATATSTSSTGSDAPYVEGPVWQLTMVRTKAGMSDDYLKALAKIYKSTNDEAKRQGVIMDYKILIGDASTAQDYDILLMVEVKNMAALDGLRDKLDPINNKLVGSQDTQRQLAVKRLEIREILGDKTMREVTLK
ncbi:MAG: hypothetical protein DLM52_12690 [Chthoniobacterales bacterium]|nr:MAG: hypothetical protein DLM52_12690 [Chthoniobacterales bacterium]